MIAAAASVEHGLLLLGGVLLLGVLAGLVARRLRVPVGISFLGMLLGARAPPC